MVASLSLVAVDNVAPAFSRSPTPADISSGSTVGTIAKRPACISATSSAAISIKILHPDASHSRKATGIGEASPSYWLSYSASVATQETADSRLASSPTEYMPFRRGSPPMTKTLTASSGAGSGSSGIAAPSVFFRSPPSSALYMVKTASGLAGRSTRETSTSLMPLIIVLLRSSLTVTFPPMEKPL